MRWTTPNLWLYRAAHRGLAWRRPTAALRAALRAGTAPAGAPGGGELPLLYLANGRLGDALLAAAFTAEYRRWFGPVVAVGRPETAAVLGPQVDRFVAFDPAAPVDAKAGWPALRAAAGGRYRALLGDLHLFHSGWQLLELAAALDLPLLAYDGWIDRGRQAPVRPWPKRTTVVPPVDKPARSTSPDDLHVWRDLQHHHRAALAWLGVAGDLPARPSLPAHLAAQPRPTALGLPAGYVACHPQSSQPKKDWPLARFGEVFAALPAVTFAVLGTDRSAPLPALANVLDLRGQTDVPTAIAVTAHARAFVGIDSGLAHAAALAGVPTVVAMPAATPGYFVPYPAAFGAHVEAVWSQQHRACAGCGGICAHEPLWRSRRQGFPCLRAVAGSDVAAAVARALAR